MAAGADSVAAANVDREPARRRGRGSGRGRMPAELAKLVEARERIPRKAFDEAISKRRRRRIRRGAVPRAGGGLGRVRLEPVSTRSSPPTPVRSRHPGRQAGPARLLRRPGDEGDAGLGRPACRERARAREAGGLSEWTARTRSASVGRHDAIDRPGDHAGRATPRRAESRHAARGASVADHPGGPALPPDPLRRAARRPGRISGWS